MFSAWNFGEWLASVGVILVMFGLVAVLSLLISAVAAAVWGEERGEASKPAGLSQPQTEVQTRTRRAA
ncbi:MAG: hypothetical protein AB1411_12790 [Nitrospirota bacterium]